MKTVVIAGGSGVVGTRLKNLLSEHGFEVLVLTRSLDRAKMDASFIHWDVQNQKIDKRFQSADHIVNLAGTGIADSRWTYKRKKEIVSSRIDSTKLLIEEAKKRSMQLESFISASAIGYYGNGGDQILTEDTGVVHHEFLSQVCVLWEKAAQQAKSISDHLSILRIGTVLSHQGGALEKMSKTIPLGIASYLGSGKQLMSWIHIDDLCGIILHILNKNISGIYNAVAPNVYTNKDFTEKLKNVINSYALLVPAPAIAIKLALGEMSRVVLNSSNVSADKILASGYKFQYPNLEESLVNIYGN